MSDKKMIFMSHQRKKGGNRDFWIHFSVILETTSKFPIVFLRLASGKVGRDEVTRSQREIDIKYESDLKVILKISGW